MWMSNSVFQTRDKGPRVLTEEEMRDLAQAYDICALKLQLPRASSWLLANPRRRKASSGLLNFLRGWMERTVPPEGKKRPAAESWSVNARPEPKSWRVGL